MVGVWVLILLCMLNYIDEFLDVGEWFRDSFKMSPFTGWYYCNWNFFAIKAIGLLVDSVNPTTTWYYRIHISRWIFPVSSIRGLHAARIVWERNSMMLVLWTVLL